MSTQPEQTTTEAPAGVDDADAIREAVNQTMELIALARMRPADFADVYASFDSGELLSEIREELDGLACWLVPTVRNLDRAYIRRLPPEERDELPGAYVAGANGKD